MTAVANPPSFQQINRSAWGASQGGGMDTDVGRMFMPRKSAQRSNSSSSIASNASSSSTSTVSQAAPQTNGASMPVAGDLSSWGTQGAARKKPQRTGPWPTSKAEPISGVSIARPQSILTTNGTSAASSMSSIHQQSPVVPSQLGQSPTQQMNGTRGNAQPIGEGNPVLYLLSMNGTFERKTISVPFYPDSLRIGRQTNVKTVPTPSNGFFDSKVLSRQHAEIWADRSGKIYIRDVKSSNGTFVNGARLSPENRDSEPHELQTQDHLELGIDIVSEDQKTVVHHKVAAKVEHAGFLGTPTNIMEMNFGDLDPANGAAMLPSQSGMSFRGRTGSQGSVASNGRLIPAGSMAGSQLNGMSQPRPMNFWLTPVTTEQIVKRLTHEMRTARIQTSDLGRTDGFFGGILSKEDMKETGKPSINESIKPQQVNGTSSPFRIDAKPRFSDPPAPPPQQPLPEKPDAIRSQSSADPSSPSSSLKRTNTERPRSGTNVSPIRSEPSSQIISLVEALSSAKKELESQSARMRDLEEMLQKERQARESAEEMARRFELQSTDSNMNGHAKGGAEGAILEEAFEPPLDPANEKPNDQAVDTKAVAESASLLEKKLAAMVVEMEQMKHHMESFRTRAESAEAERDADRKSLTEMVEKIRSEEKLRQSSEQAVVTPVMNGAAKEAHQNGSAKKLLAPLIHKADMKDSMIEKAARPSPNLGALAKPLTGSDSLLYQSTPYASMLGVVLIGMGLMAYLNGWQPPKVER
ncbi:putative VPS64 [Coleophoma crateriformis]|uniref:Putative VPS64 n=1 Tax=Coleophoma crateriformis TaxID=565419 RepID=A0A3D8QI02_9HELO|nr:putative VPS64 [Coleophoma crateriformis]